MNQRDFLVDEALGRQNALRRLIYEEEAYQVPIVRWEDIISLNIGLDPAPLLS